MAADTSKPNGNRELGEIQASIRQMGKNIDAHHADLKSEIASVNTKLDTHIITDAENRSKIHERINTIDKELAVTKDRSQRSMNMWERVMWVGLAFGSGILTWLIQTNLS